MYIWRELAWASNKNPFMQANNKFLREEASITQVVMQLMPLLHENKDTNTQSC